MVEALSRQELELLDNYDSRLFGFLRWFEPVSEGFSNVNHGTLLRKGVEVLEQQLKTQGKKVNPRIYCQLGHFHLLLEDFSKAMSAYQRFFNLHEEYFKDAPFLYGLGIVYFHYNAYQWAIKAFQQLLYIDPSFGRSNEVHLRLGLMFKAMNNFDASLKHFQLALLDSNPCSLSKVEIQFHIAHLFEMQNKFGPAKDAYQAIISAQGMPPHIQSVAWRQLGWMYHSHEQLGDKTQRTSEAVQCLQKSLELDPSSGSSWYFLGRCYAQLGRVHEAFTAYRHAIDKAEANADTWCSIGVLYQQQNQPMDALQAYICAVQLDNSHVAAWTDLGVLYESSGQTQDGIICYTNALRSCGNSNPGLESRMKFLQSQMSTNQTQDNNKKTLPLPNIEEAWKLPIPAELTTRTVRLVQQARMNQQAILQARSQYLFSPTPQQQETQQQQTQQQQTQQQQHQHNQQQQHIQLQQHPQLQQQQQQQKALQRQFTQPALQAQGSNSGNFPGSGSFQAPPSNGHPLNLQHIVSSAHEGLLGTVITQSLNHTQANTTLTTNMNSMNGFMQNVDQTTQLQGSGSPKVPAGPWNRASLATNQTELRNQSQNNSGFAQTPPDIPKTSSQQETLNVLNGINSNYVTSPNMTNPGGLLSPKNNTNFSVESPLSSPTLNQSNARPSVYQPLTISNPSNSLLSPGLLSPNLLSPHQGLSSPSTPRTPGSLNGYKLPKISCLLDPKDVPAPPPPPEPPLSVDRLSPPTPSITVETKREAMSAALKRFCLDPKNPVTVIKGLCMTLKLDIGLFTTKTLVEQNPDHTVEIRHQRQQASDENWDLEGKSKVWYCHSSRSSTTVAKYAQYQAKTYQDSLKDKDGLSMYTDSDSSTGSKSGRKRSNGQFKMIKFGTNVDLSDTKKWKRQLAELSKLPPFCKVVCGSNMLSHVGHNVLGMNTVQLYMKIPGCRTPGHQENLNFCSLNINVGPGDCEWFCTPCSYWGVIHSLCEKHNINFLIGSWWPLLEDLYEERVPVYRFIQKPGDAVWINAGTVHWVQALGWCNNIAWNVGPLTEHQFNLCVERYEWNKLQDVKSIVPMINLTWNLARNIKASESKLAEHIRAILARSLKYCEVTIELCKQSGIEVVWHGREKNEAAHYCTACEVEVFNLLFVKEVNKKLLVHCQDCARKTSSNLDGFSVLNQIRQSLMIVRVEGVVFAHKEISYKMEDLREIYRIFCNSGSAAISLENNVSTDKPTT